MLQKKAKNADGNDWPFHLPGFVVGVVRVCLSAPFWHLLKKMV